MKLFVTSKLIDLGLAIVIFVVLVVASISNSHAETIQLQCTQTTINSAITDEAFVMVNCK